MAPGPDTTPNWRQAIGATVRGCKPLVFYEILMSWLSATVLGPLMLALSYRVIELSGESALGHAELLDFLRSPLGATAIVLGIGLTLGIALIEYSGLILLADAAIRQCPLSLRQILVGVASAATRLLGVAVLQTGGALVLALPFGGLAAAVYWLLLSGTDINFYLSERPPTFWVAATIGGLLAIGLAASTLWCFVGWAFAVPACVLDRRQGVAAVRFSLRLPRSRAWRLVGLLGGWQLLRVLAFMGAIAALDRINGWFFTESAGSLTTWIWSSVALLLLDSLVLQLLGIVFVIGAAALMAYQYQQARQEQAGRLLPVGDTVNVLAQQAPHPLPRPIWRIRAALLAIVLLGPAVSVVSSLLLAREFVDHRPARVTAHRAGSKAAPENSLAALRLALAAGADDVEIDVQLTADGHVVLLHDRDLRRVTGDPRNLHELNLSDLKGLRLRDWRGVSEEGIPTLAEFIAACDNKIRLNVELKDFGQTPGLALAVLKVLRQQQFATRAGVSSFQMASLREIKQAEPTMRIGIIMSALQGDATRLPVDFLSLNQRLVTTDLIRRAHQRGQEVHAWTVNDRAAAVRLLDLGCDNLITSDPALMREVVDWYTGLGDTERMLLRLRRWVRQ